MTAERAGGLRLATARWIATWFGCGLVPWAPGTVGAAAGLVMVYVLMQYTGAGKAGLSVLILAMTPIGIWSAGVAAKSSGRKDPGHVVVDEVLGQWVAVAGVEPDRPASWLLAFLLFRVFDILKPPPVRRLERLASGWGIVADDLMAGLYAALVLFGAGCFNLY